jgi:biopolymer transport protein ExbB
MMREVSTNDFAARSRRLLAAAGLAAALTIGGAFAQAEKPAADAAAKPEAAPAAATAAPAAAVIPAAAVVAPIAQTAAPTVTPPANATGPAEEAPPPPPALNPDGSPATPAVDPNAPPADPNAAPVVAPAEAAVEEEKKEGGAHDMSPLGMFLMATIVVKLVMVSLVLASVVTWALLISKWLSMASLNSTTSRVLRDFRDAKSLQDAAGKLSRSAAATPAGRMLLAAADELRASGAPSTGEKREHLTSRISARMSIAQAESNQEIGGGMQILATTGSISPFVGLFGTVYGIMNSFIGIAQSQTTNLAVVAPGIAEALFATAIGLFAAIPAVIFYNYFARGITAYNTRLDNFSGEVLVRLSRQLDAGA